MYKFIVKPLLFLLPPEKAHHFTFSLLKFILNIPLAKSIYRAIFCVEDKALACKVGGITFPGPVGLAAGFDKNALMTDELSVFGFGFIEIGTVTPRPQPGNPQPRLFRLPADEALINRMGFNNDGAEIIATRLRQRKDKIIIGGNIGKNKTTPNENALDDYVACFNALYDYVDYFVVNVSSPNTPGLRELQDREPLTNLLEGVQNLNQSKKSPKPVFLKIAPDLTYTQVDEIIEIVKVTNLTGLIISNTTISRDELKTDPAKVQEIGAGGVSGKPVRQRSTELIHYVCKEKNAPFDVIGVGGIHSADDAIEKMEAGAKLVQVFTGFIYAGPSLIHKINKRVLAQRRLGG
ncbi:MAG: quinone-dependent dihydroorotate dehydrogenase [Bacteroidetes bacterium]|jgi:dihydroorotate dehydrogenase|nr:quinone-dependent dihydroorotate dehydrogenase [Bacteroidota bacterium]